MSDEGRYKYNIFLPDSAVGKLQVKIKQQEETIATLTRERDEARDRLLTVSADRNKHVEQSECYRQENAELRGRIERVAFQLSVALLDCPKPESFERLRNSIKLIYEQIPKGEK